MVPTPSHPIKNWSMLFAVTRVNMANKNKSRYLKNWLMYGSMAMYHEANSKIDQVTNSAMGRNVTAYMSSMKLMLILKLVT